jgi:hypothetical protein
LITAVALPVMVGARISMERERLRLGSHFDAAVAIDQLAERNRGGYLAANRGGAAALARPSTPTV